MFGVWILLKSNTCKLWIKLNVNKYRVYSKYKKNILLTQYFRISLYVIYFVCTLIYLLIFYICLSIIFCSEIIWPFFFAQFCHLFLRQKQTTVLDTFHQIWKSKRFVLLFSFQWHHLWKRACYILNTFKDWILAIRAGIQSSWLGSNSNFYWQKQVQDWTSRLISACILTQSSNINL